MSETKIYDAHIERIDVRLETLSLRARLLELRAREQQGPRGPEGPPGPIGPTPRHEWRELVDGRIELRFEIAPDTWGPWSENLRGPRGFAGGGMGGGFIQTDPTPTPTPTTSDGSVPYFIAADEVYEVPIYRQALFARTIDCEGGISIEGDLIMVA